jgi:hypothetical protein
LEIDLHESMIVAITYQWRNVIGKTIAMGEWERKSS